jgi:RNA polymerase sigma-70 factor (ECF subfamily)
MLGDAPALEAHRMSTIDAAVRGDQMAFARIVRDHHDDMVRVCQVIAGDPDIAQEAAQRSWPIAWQRLRTLRDPSKLRPWLVTIAANEARQILRRERRDRIVPLQVADAEAAGHGFRDGDPAARAAALDLLGAVRRLAPADRTLLALRYVAGFDATEIGAATGMSASGVRTRLSRLVTRLREEVGE